jgi:hypothetical protein
MSETKTGAPISAPSASAAAPPELAQAGDVHVLAMNSSGSLFHTLRKAGGAWLPFRDVMAVAGNPGTVEALGSATVGGELHVLAATIGGGPSLFHAVRRVDGSWKSFRKITGETGNLPGAIHSMAAANVGGVLHVAAIADQPGPGSKLMHTLLGPNGKFVPFGDVEAAASEIGNAEDVAIVGSPGQLQLVALTSTVNSDRVWHAVR